MIADTMGIWMDNAGSSPLANLTSGVFRLTSDGMHLVDEYPGTKRYSLNVLDGSS